VGDVSVVVVVVELVTGAGATTTGAGAGTTATGAGTVSTTGAGAVDSTVLWYEQPATSPKVAITAGNIAIRLIDRILVASIGYMTLVAARSRPLRMGRFALILGTEGAVSLRKSFRVGESG